MRVSGLRVRNKFAAAELKRLELEVFEDYGACDPSNVSREAQECRQQSLESGGRVSRARGVVVVGGQHSSAKQARRCHSVAETQLEFADTLLSATGFGKAVSR